MPGLSLRSLLPAVVAGSLLTLAPVAVSSPAQAADPVASRVYHGLCAAHHYTVPPGVAFLDITVIGEPGHSGTPGRYAAGSGGRGGKVRVTMAVTPGQTFWGSPDSKILRGGGQWNYAFGGNGSLVTNVDPTRYCGTEETLPKSAIVLVAGGGGGGAYGESGQGGNGGNAGQPGSDGGSNAKKDGAGGAAGGQTAGGGGGNNGSAFGVRSGEAGHAGRFLRGGLAGFDGAFGSAYPGAEPVAMMNAGSGGGGFYGGGGGGGASAGSASGGGGGGSNYVTPSVPTTTPTATLEAGVRFNGAAAPDEYTPRVDFNPVYPSQTSAVRSSANPAPEGKEVTFSVTVTRSDGQVPGGGTVEFFDGSSVVATGHVDASTGIASAAVSTLRPGTHPIQAHYRGVSVHGVHVGTSWAPSEVLRDGQVVPFRQTTTAVPKPVAPVVTKQPEGSPKYYDISGHFDAEASGYPTPSVQWQESSDGGHVFHDVAGGTERAFRAAAAVSKNGHLYRAVFTNSAGTATTRAAKLTVIPVHLSVVPVDASMFPGSEVPVLTASYPHYHPHFGRTLAQEVKRAPKCTTTATSHSPVGEYPITCSGGVMPNYEPVFRSGTLTVAAHSHATSFTVPHAQSSWYAGDWIHLGAQGGESDHPVEFSVNHNTPEGVCEVHGSILMLSATPSEPDDCLVTATQPGVSHAPPVTRAVRLHQPRHNATLIAPARAAVGESSVLTVHGYQQVGHTSKPTSDAVVTVLHHTAGICSVSTAEGVTLVHYLAEGRCTLHAQQPNEAGRAGGTTQVVYVHLPIKQHITFTSTFPTAPEAGTTTHVTATGGGSSHPVVLGTETPATCFFRGTTLYLLSRGSCTAVAHQAGGGGYAPGVARHVITVATNTQIAFFPPSTGHPGQVLTLTATKVPSGRPPVSFAVGSGSGAGVCTLSGASLTLHKVGRCEVVAKQPSAGLFNGSVVNRTITVTPR